MLAILMANCIEPVCAQPPQDGPLSTKSSSRRPTGMQTPAKPMLQTSPKPVLPSPTKPAFTLVSQPRSLPPTHSAPISTPPIERTQTSSPQTSTPQTNPLPNPLTDASPNAAQTGAKSGSENQTADRMLYDRSSQSDEVDVLQVEQLTLADVVASTYRTYPQIEQARLEAPLASGQSTAAMGYYDYRLQSYSLSEPTGFYRNYRNGIGVIRKTWWGGYVDAGYRLGSGSFAPWYKEKQTNGGGEFALGLGFPLLQGRAIDASRVAVFQAGLAQQAVGPQVQVAILEHSFEAARHYWDWVAAGARLLAQQELLDLANERQKQFEDGAEAGKFARIDVVFNKQLVAERASKKIEAEQKYQASAFKLSLFLRDELGAPLIPQGPWLPRHFPAIDPVDELDFNANYTAALTRRPELVLLQIDVQKIELERRLAANQRLPALELVSQASQDVGTPTSSLNDKGQFELLVGVQSDFPIQRRGAAGKQLQAGAKISQLDQKIRLQRDKIGVELQVAQNALILAGRRLEQVQAGLEAAFESLQAYRYAFQRGYADLLYLNILESKANEAELYMVDAQRDWFIALAQTQAACGLDPLEQAVAISSLPESKRPGPGDLPRPQNPSNDQPDSTSEKVEDRVKSITDNPAATTPQAPLEDSPAQPTPKP